MNIGKKQRINESWEYMLEHDSQHYSQDISLHIPYIFSTFLKINPKKSEKKRGKKSIMAICYWKFTNMFPNNKNSPKIFPYMFSKRFPWISKPKTMVAEAQYLGVSSWNRAGGAKGEGSGETELLCRSMYMYIYTFICIYTHIYVYIYTYIYNVYRL